MVKKRCSRMLKVIGTKLDNATYNAFIEEASKLNKTKSEALRLAIGEFMVNHSKTANNQSLPSEV